MHVCMSVISRILYLLLAAVMAGMLSWMVYESSQRELWDALFVFGVVALFCWRTFYFALFHWDASEHWWNFPVLMGYRSLTKKPIQGKEHQGHGEDRSEQAVTEEDLDEMSYEECILHQLNHGITYDDDDYVTPEWIIEQEMAAIDGLATWISDATASAEKNTPKAEEAHRAPNNSTASLLAAELTVVAQSCANRTKLIKLILQAQSTGLELAMDYRDANGAFTQRVVMVEGILWAESGEFLIRGYCRLRQAPRTFRLDRIEDAAHVPPGGKWQREEPHWN